MDSERSKMFCIYGDCLEELQREVINRINDVHSCSTGMPSIACLTINPIEQCLHSEQRPLVKVTFPRSPPHVEDDFLVYFSLIYSLIQLCDEPQCIITSSVAVSLHSVQFSRIPYLLKESPFRAIWTDHHQFRANVCHRFRDSRYIPVDSSSPLHLSSRIRFATRYFGKPRIRYTTFANR